MGIRGSFQFKFCLFNFLKNDEDTNAKSEDMNTNFFHFTFNELNFGIKL
jgi:hypothetical protein